MVLLNNNFEQKVKRIKTDKNGNYIILDMVIEEKEITLVNLYGPNEDNPQFYENLIKKIAEFENDNVIVCGDWNLVINPEIDSHNYLHINNPKARQIVLNLLEEENFIDAWRVMNEDSRKYTWRRLNPQKKQARLDFYLVSETLFQFVIDSDIVAGYRTDHSGIILKLKLQENERGRGYWKFNNTLLKDKKYIEEIKNTIEEVKNTYIINDNVNERVNISNEQMKFNINDQLFLETLLMIIRGNTIKYSAIKKRKKNEEEKKLEEEINSLEEEINSDFLNTDYEKIQKLVEIKEKLVELRKEKVDGVMLRSRCRYQDLGEKPSKYFFNLESRNFTNKVITKLVDEDGSEFINTQDVLNCQKRFYENLYDSNNNISDNPIESEIGENLNKLSDFESEKLEGNITFSELSSALKNMKNDKSPGLDGFTVEFFKFFWIDIGMFVLRSLNYGYVNGSLSVTQIQGIITCLPKPNKCRHNLKNWRPISLLNVVYKMASAVIANRIKTVLNNIICEEQKGFISGRCIGENIRTIYDILFEAKNQDLPGLILSIDFEKAFDTVSWSFIEKVLKYFNFGPSVISWIKLFQNGSESCIIQNGFMSDFFKLKRGCRQGDPISPYIFIMCAEVLGHMIRNEQNIKGIEINGKEHRLSQYADDTQIFLDGTEESLSRTLTILTSFYKMSGLKINVEKTKAIWIGISSNSKRQLCKDYKLDWTQGPFKILGVTFTTELYNIWDVNTNEILTKIETLCSKWSKRKLTLLGRITVIKSLALAKFIHLFLALPNPPGELIKKLDKLFYKFLWNSGPDRIKRSVIIKDLQAGGLRMININIFIKALKLSWLRRVIKTSKNESWFSLSKIDFQTIFCLGSGCKKLPEISNLQNPFWIDIITCWSDFCNKFSIETAQHILDSPVWHNQKLINGGNLYISDWYKKGIRYVSDLIDENGNLYEFVTLKNRYGLKGTFLDYQSVLRKIPKSWMILLNNNKIISFNSRFNVKCSIYVQQLIKDKKGCRLLYDIMIDANKPIIHTRWLNEVGDISEHQWKNYNRVIQKVNEVKLKDFQYKIINRILVTKSFLFKISKVDDNLCEYCKQYPESIYHLFVQCEKVKQFWNQLKDWLSVNSNIHVELNDRNILFSHQDANQLKTYLFVIAKYYVYSNKFSGKELIFDNFLSLLERKFNNEKYIACINGNTAKFFSKWYPLYQYFNRV